MSIETEDELRALRAAGRVVARALRAMRAAVAPGVSTAELDAVGARVFRRSGARSGPQLDYGFPAVTCISVNEEAVHGVPGRRRLRQGDLVKLDVTAELDGFYADACVSVPVGRVAPAVMARFVPGLSQGLTEGLVLTIEPIVSAGTGAVEPAGDGWTLRTADGALSAHHEHTIVITQNAPIVLTA